MVDFVSLHNHTHYSILNALSSPKDLFVKAKELGQKAIAITDLSTFASAWDSLKVSKETGVKLIIGCEFNFVNDANKKDDRIRKIILLAKNAEGYRNILMMNREAFDQGLQLTKKLIPLIDWNLLKKYSAGTICLTGGGDGIIGNLINNKKMIEAEEQLKLLKEIFNENLGVEIQPNNMIRQANYYNDSINQIFTNFQLIKLAKKINIKIVPATGSFYINKDDAEIFDIMLSIGAMQPAYSNNRLRYPAADFYVKSGDEIKAFFERNFGEEFALEICKNTVDFTDSCEEPNWIDPKFSNPTGKELPDFPVRDEEDYTVFLEWKNNQSEELKKLDEDKLYLRYKCYQALDKRIPKEKYKQYQDRLEEELDVLGFCGVSSYMLIVADYINYCRKNNIMVGPGRGSVGGSLTGYLLDIHQADSIKYGLVFPRFHNKMKASYSDIDSDFSKVNRDKVLEYISNKYGKDNVVQICNYNLIKPKIYAKDLARSCELGGSRQEAVRIGTVIADSLPKDIKTVDEAFEQAALFVEYSKRYPELIKYRSIASKPRNTSIHASGVIIGKRPLIGIFPIKKDKDGVVSTEYHKDDCDENGLVKMDVLGLETLDIIEETGVLIKMTGKEIPKIDIEGYDKKTYDLISEGRTFCVFQFGTSSGTMDLCKKIKPKNMEDLAIITTIARPSSREIRDDFIKAKKTGKKNKLLHPSLENALKATYGYSIYDESLLLLAKDVAGWDLADSDKLRKLTKEKGKSPQKVKKWEQEFIEGSKNNGIDEVIASKIWEEVIVPFGRYSFNKSHAVLYSMISYHTAYLKAHYPVEFLLANLKAKVNSGSKKSKSDIEKIKQEIRSYNVKILPPSINESDFSYKLIDDKTLLTGLDALKSVGDPCIQDILEKRPFKSFSDFMVRTDNSKVRSNSIQALAAAGALDCFNIPRHLIFIYCSDYRKKLTTWLKRHDPNIENFEYKFTENEKEWTKPEMFSLERWFIGESLTINKQEGYGNFFKSNNFINIKDFKDLPKKTQIPSIKAEVKDFFELKVKKEGSKYFGQPMCKINLEDINGDSISLTIFPDSYKSITEGLKKEHGNKIKLEIGICLHFSASLDEYESEKTLSLSQLYSIAPIPQIPKYAKIEKTIKEPKENAPKSESLDINNMSDIEQELFDGGFIDLD